MKEIDLILVSRPEWLSDLPLFQQDLIEQLREGRELDEVARAWLEASSPNTAPFGALQGAKLFYEKVVDQVHDLLCDQDKYEDERASLAREYGTGKTTFAASVTAFVGPLLGADPTMLTPVIAVILTVISQAGLRAWCELQSERRARDGGG